ncbi:amino acid adenylation domain-containing protein [Nocardia sp. X0981]
METARRPSRGSRRRHPGSPLFGQLLTAAVESAAGEVAIRYNPTGDPADQREMTYQELDEASSQVARELIERGVGPGDVVAIGIARGMESVLAVWAVAKTGAACLPIDPSGPSGGIDHRVTDSAATLGLTTSKHRAALGTSLYWLELDDPVQAGRIARRPRHPITYADRVRMLDEQHPAYIVYTTDSTGVPVPHSGLGAVVAAADEHYGITGISRVAHLCPPDTDRAILELLLTFGSGATLVIVPPDVSGGNEPADTVRREAVTHIIATPAELASLAAPDLPDLGLVVVSGNGTGPEPAGHRGPEHSVVHSYGASETTVVAISGRPVRAGEPVTFGDPLNGFGVFVLDARLRPVPSGAVGELYLSGPALAQGYLNRPALTAGRFVAGPFGAAAGRPGLRMYRTGDLVRRIDTPYGTEFEYLGRTGVRETTPEPEVEEHRTIELAKPTVADEVTGAAPPVPDRHPAHGVAAEVAAEPVRETELAYWRDVLASPDPLLGSRAVDPTADTRATARRFALDVPAEIAAKVLTEVPGLYRTGPGDPLLAALALAVRNWRSRRGVDCAISRIRVAGTGRDGSVVSGAEPSRTAGPVTTAYPVALDLSGIDAGAALSGGQETAALMRSVKEQLAAVPSGGAGFALLRRTENGIADEFRGSPAQIGFVYHDRHSARDTAADGGTGEPGDIEVVSDPARPVDAVVDIDAAHRADGGITVGFTYAARIVDEDLVRELAEDWLAAVRAVARHTEDPAAGGLTPSDLPLVRVEQAELDTWWGRYPGLQDVLPLSPPAAGLFVHSQLTANVPDDYVMLLALELGGVVELERLRIAAQHLLDRYPVLRSVFVTTADGTPVCLVTGPVEVPWQVVEGVGDYEMADLLGAERRTRFAVDTAPLLRTTVYRTVSGRTHFVLVAHHLLFDRRSIPILLRDLLALYAARGEPAALPAPPAYREYSQWLARRNPEPDRIRWTEALRGARRTELAAVLATPTEPGTGIGELDLVFDETETAALAAYAAAAGGTVEMVAQALWAVLLASLTGHTEVVFGAVVPGRPAELAGAGEMVGLFTGTVPVRVRFEPEWTLRELLTSMRTEQATLLDHHYPGPAAVSPGAARLFDTLLAYDPHPVNAAALRAANGGDDGLQIVELTSRTFNHYPVTLMVEASERLLLRLWYRRDTVAESAARALSGLLHTLVSKLLALPAPAAALTSGWWRVPGALGGHGELPADRPRSDTPSGRSGRITRELDGELRDALDTVAGQWDTDSLTVVQAALAVLVARLSGGRDIAVGASSTRGSAPEPVVLHTEIDPARGFGTLLDTAREVMVPGAVGRGGQRLGHLIDTVRTTAGQPPFRVLLASEREPGALPEDLDLRVDLVDTDTGAALTFTYARDLFDTPTIGDHADRLVRILAAVAADPAVTIGDIDLLAPGERELVLREWNSAGASVPPATLVDLIEARARLRPAAPAVRFGDTTLSFGELLDRSYRVARGLIAAGAGPESLVAVAIPRTEELPVALLGVLLSGAAYLPLDTAQPRRRSEFVLGDARPAVVLTVAAERDAVPAGESPVVLVEDTVRHSAAPVTDVERYAPLRPGNTAYVVYTSGTTGTPKGVAVTHRNVVELFANTQLLFEFDDTDVWTLFHSFTFDFSVWELWCALASGGSVVVVDQPTSRSPEQFRELLIREKVTVLNQTPSAFYQLAEADRVAGDGGTPALRYVVLGGEAVDPRELRRWYERYGAPGGTSVDAPWLVNMYGITETTVHVSFLPLVEQSLDHSAGVIGRALPGLDAFVLDDRLHPAPVGVPGEIYVAGAQLARGYLGRPGLTATRFVADPFGAPGSRMYRSGDIGRWAGFGGRADLEYGGRRDTQVQLRGFRIELGEVEAVLRRCTGVGQAAAAVRGDGLVGYVVPAADFDGAPDPVVLREQAGEFLAGYMVPGTVVVLDALPLTPSGKLDRAALPEAGITVRAPYTAPEGRTQTVVAEVFADVLGADRVGADDDFFTLGGHSLSAVRAVARINAALRADLVVSTLFEAPTVAGLAARVVPGVEVTAPRPALNRAERPDRIPLSLAQRHLWYSERAGSAAGNISLAVGFTGALDTSALRYAIFDVLERHEVLRTRYPADSDGLPYQEILPVAQVLRGSPETEETEDVLGRIGELRSAGFDITAQVPVRGLLLTAGADEHVLAVVVHRIAADEASLVPLVRDLATAYLARVSGESPRWPPLPVQYADYAIWQQAVVGVHTDENSIAAKQLDYWREQLREPAAAPELPLDRLRPSVPSLRGGTTGCAVDAGTHSCLDALARDRGTTLFTVLHAAVSVLLYQLTGAGDIVIATPVDGRGEAVPDNLIGRFANTLALRTRVRSGQTFAELVDAARDTERPAFAAADIPFDQVVSVVAPDRATGLPPLSGVVLSSRDSEQIAVNLPGLTVRGLGRETLAADFELRIDIDPDRDTDGAPGELRAVLTYAVDLFDEETVRSFGRRLERILRTAAANPWVRVGAIETDDEDEHRDDGTSPFREIPFTEPVVPVATTGTALAQALGASVEEDPEGPAVVQDEEAMTYRELDARSSQLARTLIGRGCGPGTGVVIALERGIDAVVATWAVLKAGATVVPADAVAAAAAAELVVEAGVAADRPPTLPGVKWLILGDPATAAETAAQSPRPVTYAHRIRPLRGDDLAVVDASGRRVGYDQLAAAVTRVHAATDLTYEARTFCYGRSDSTAAILEIVAAGAAGASVVLVPENADTVTPATEWVTHLWSDPTGLARLDPAELDDLTALIVDGDSSPGVTRARVATVLDLPTLLR